MQTNIKPGSRWLSSEMKEFIVISVPEVEGRVWVHYRTNFKEENTEHSCLIESFLSRFGPAPE
jgi:hypothetical protein